ncbi:hypothetical protein [Flavobacterium sp. N1736]|uniref:hypothetical protein n=1 Tax=Flavobacterium sp. N1736 TaxID=2986823 RepID=UPI0022247C53|nr:hypothetical protein [Flavobacterium sp. N1736]
MKTKIITITSTLLITITAFSQQIGDGRSLRINDFTVPLKAGLYEAQSPVGTIPDLTYGGYQHLFVIRHSNDVNNHELQIASSFSDNDRLFFRKSASYELNPINPNWNELATRGTNNFIGDQNISGNVGIGTITPSNLQGWGKVLDVAGDHHSKILATAENALYKVGIFSHNQEWYGGGGFVGTESDHPLHLITNYNVKMSVLTNGNVGIGTLNPTSKLTVAGNIASREVKVTVDAGADFVFENDYDLPSLDSVDKFIKENKHLPEIASAEEMKKDGINLSEMNIKLLQKMEEMTLYMIEQNKKIEILEKKVGEILKK